jgi:hypothetical protein
MSDSLVIKFLLVGFSIYLLILGGLVLNNLLALQELVK